MGVGFEPRVQVGSRMFSAVESGLLSKQEAAAAAARLKEVDRELLTRIYSYRLALGAPLLWAVYTARPRSGLVAAAESLVY